MKNLVLIDFTKESIDALAYATDFSKEMKGTLAIVNVSEPQKKLEVREELEKLQSKFSTPDFHIQLVELVGEMEQELPAFIDKEKPGFVFCGTHELRMLEPFFSSRVLTLMNSVKSNFIFIPDNLEKFSPIKEVLVPIFSDKHSIQNIEALRYLHQFIPFKIKLVMPNSTDPELKSNILVASKLLNQAGITHHAETIGKTEDDLRNGLADTAKLLKTDLISIVNLTEVNLFNFGAKGFVENLIRNENGLPILVIQNQQVEYYSGFHTSGGY